MDFFEARGWLPAALSPPVASVSSSTPPLPPRTLNNIRNGSLDSRSVPLYDVNDVNGDVNGAGASVLVKTLSLTDTNASVNRVTTLRRPLPGDPT